MSNIAIDRQATFSLLIAQEIQATPGRLIRRQNHGCFTAELVIQGRGWVNIERQRYNMKQGDMYFLPPGLDHEYGADKEHPWRKIFFNVGGILPEKLIECYNIHCFRYKEWDEPEIFHRMLWLYEDLSPIATNEAALLFHKLILIAAKKQGVMGHLSTPVVAAANFIEDNLLSSIGLRDIASASCLSPSQLTRLFKIQIGCPPYSYLCKRRIEMAKHLLSCTDMQICNIATRLQFADAFYFSNTFKKHVGVSPRHFRCRTVTAAQ